MPQKRIAITLGAAICGLACVALVLLAGDWIRSTISTHSIGQLTFGAGMLGLALVLAGFQMRLLRRAWQTPPTQRK